MVQFEGPAFCFGDDINTDYIISSRRKRDTLDVNILKQYIMEDIRPGFFHELNGTTILVAGENFGCGSAMEVATQVVKGNNIPVILAKSFARSYYRNAINNGILIVEMDTSSIREKDLLRITMDDNGILVEDLSNKLSVRCPGLRKELENIILSGGLIKFVKLQRGQKEGC
ncbi:MULTISPECIES: LeuD/DmdB family oxidoreductase small subunit [Eubacteriales]|uniref:LeuD/DmdB family oxidoreductase small subunit n=1 Tax=Eubacteriales TaxID=186802 RepID=UPI000820B70D|nr:3-isopropylmalate dehydratase [Muriventricola aceti]MCU6702091.1 3-isopropylmalate dehydratase [Muriventricola aceti]SCI89367.1 2%2C3-dimethylmalate dehydratase small subunit [uncultured Flavonifractor sp.]